MKNFILLLVAFISIFKGDGYAQECSEVSCIDSYDWEDRPYYAKISGGVNFLQTDRRGGVDYNFETGFIFSGSLGTHLCHGFHLEAEYAFRRNCGNNVHFFGRTFSVGGHFQSSSYMANLIWDVPLEKWGCYFCGIQPFIGGGIGYDIQHIHLCNYSFTMHGCKKDFAWQILAGLKYPVFCHADLSLSYKFHQGGFSQIYCHSLEIGLSYNYGSSLFRRGN